MIDETKLEQAVEAFLNNETWAEYYGNAPSGAKEIIALEFYASENDVDGDAEFDALEKECRDALEAEDIQYLAEKSPNAQERSFYAKMLNDKGGSAEGANGASGASGESGATGITGATGESGQSGGETGASGAQGVTGQSGSEAVGGLTGATGEALGVTGAQGTSGAVGTTGETGQTGQTVA